MFATQFQYRMVFRFIGLGKAGTIVHVQSVAGMAGVYNMQYAPVCEEKAFVLHYHEVNI